MVFFGQAETFPCPYCLPIPREVAVWNPYGEDSAFPGVLHIETVIHRAAAHDRQVAVHRDLRLHQFLVAQAGDGRIELDGPTLRTEPAFLPYVPAGVGRCMALPLRQAHWAGC